MKLACKIKLEDMRKERDALLGRGLRLLVLVPLLQLVKTQLPTGTALTV